MVRLQKGDFMATILDIAEKLGVSKGTVSKALNGAPDISETLRKTILETAVEMGYTRRRRQKQTAKKLCILVENLDYEEPHQFGYDIVTGFRQMAEPAGFLVEIFPSCSAPSLMICSCSSTIISVRLPLDSLFRIHG